MPPERADLAIVGGGVAGLFAAWRARRRTLDGRAPVVRVLEAAAAPGGVVATVDEAGFRIERAASSIRGASLELLAAIRELGLADQLVPAAPCAAKRWVAWRGRLEPTPAGPLSFVTSPLLTAGAKLRLAREPFVGEPAARQDETLASFVARRFGEGIVDPLLDAVVTGIFAGDVRRLEAASALPRMVELAAQHGSVVRGFLAAARARKREGISTRGLFALRGGMASLVAALTRSLGDALTCDARVVAVRRIDEGDTRWEIEDARGRLVRARAVVLATPAWAAAPLLEPLAPGLARELAAIEAANVAVVALGVARAQVGADVDGLGFLVPRSESSPLLGVLFESSLFPERAPAGRVLLRCMVGGERLALPDGEAANDAIADLAWREAARYLRLTGAPELRRVFVHKPGIPQYRPGHARRLAKIDDLLASDARLAGLQLAGWSYRGIALNDAARESALRPTRGDS
jgi:oxygen-dependent protoporphyrinogen oxidase